MYFVFFKSEMLFFYLKMHYCVVPGFCAPQTLNLDYWEGQGGKGAKYVICEREYDPWHPVIGRITVYKYIEPWQGIWSVTPCNCQENDGPWQVHLTMS